jgi:hypothetical protein
MLTQRSSYDLSSNMSFSHQLCNIQDPTPPIHIERRSSVTPPEAFAEASNSRRGPVNNSRLFQFETNGCS